MTLKQTILFAVKYPYPYIVSNKQEHYNYEVITTRFSWHSLYRKLPVIGKLKSTSAKNGIHVVHRSAVCAYGECCINRRPYNDRLTNTSFSTDGSL